jgi:hypothetical protein
MLSGKRASASSRSQASASEALGDFRSADLLDHSAWRLQGVLFGLSKDADNKLLKT